MSLPAAAAAFELLVAFGFGFPSAVWVWSLSVVSLAASSLPAVASLASVRVDVGAVVFGADSAFFVPVVVAGFVVVGVAFGVKSSLVVGWVDCVVGAVVGALVGGVVTVPPLFPPPAF